MGRERRFDAITFDFWDTLVRTSGGDTRAARGRSVAAALGRHGHEVDGDTLERAFEHAWVIYDDAWRQNRQVTAVDAGGFVLDHLAVELSPDARLEVIEAFTTGAAGLEVDLTDHLEETLVAIKERELGLGIICDVGLTPSPVLRSYLASHGVLDLFDHWSFSDEVGCYKPARPIFEHALAGLGGVDPTRVAHVGDLRRTDIAGAQALGITAVRYSGANDDPTRPGLPEGDHVIADHADLLDVLDLT